MPLTKMDFAQWLSIHRLFDSSYALSICLSEPGRRIYRRWMTVPHSAVRIFCRSDTSVLQVAPIARCCDAILKETRSKLPRTLSGTPQSREPRLVGTKDLPINHWNVSHRRLFRSGTIFCTGIELSQQMQFGDEPYSCFEGGRYWRVAPCSAVSIIAFTAVQASARRFSKREEQRWHWEWS